MYRLPQAPVAQLDRASVYGTESRRFESFRMRWSKAPLGAFGDFGRWVPGNARGGTMAEEDVPESCCDQHAVEREVVDVLACSPMS